jgi:ribosomal protein L36
MRWGAELLSKESLDDFCRIWGLKLKVFGNYRTKNGQSWSLAVDKNVCSAARLVRRAIRNMCINSRLPRHCHVVAWQQLPRIDRPCNDRAAAFAAASS